MVSIRQNNNLSDWLVWEQKGYYSRKCVSLTANQQISSGQIVFFDKKTNEYTSRFIASNKKQAKAGIAIDFYGAKESKQTIVIIARQAIVFPNKLIFPQNINSNQKDKIENLLKGQGIIFGE